MDAFADGGLVVVALRGIDMAEADAKRLRDDLGAQRSAHRIRAAADLRDANASRRHDLRHLASSSLSPFRRAFGPQRAGSRDDNDCVNIIT